ncbi:MAG: DnaD domain protein [Clostridia bacterium]|nr:DnaD domain protein [Clostridia bacterium]
MSFCNFSKENTNSGKILLDNLFVSNYLPELNEEAVKVYLYGLYLCQNSSLDFDVTKMASTLSLSVDQVKDNFKYLEEYGLVLIVSKNPFTVNFIPVNDSGVKYKRYKPEKYEDLSKALQVIISERMISTTEYSEYFNLLETTPLKPEAFLMIVKYCTDLKGADISYKYIVTVVKDFVNRNITTEDLVEKELSNYNALTKEIGELFRTLKITRKQEVEDIQFYKKWCQKYSFEHEIILFTAKQSKIKNLKTLDKTFDELYASKCFTEEDVSNFLKTKQEKVEICINVCKALGIYVEIYDTVITNYVSPWLSMGYDHKTLVFIANYCFKSNRRTLEQMNATVNNLMKLGYVTLDNIVAYINEFNSTDKFIYKILEYLGLSRKPNGWDRENVKTWRRDWNFSDDVILEASKRASGSTNPIPYMNAILSNWKNNGAFTLEQVSKINPPTSKNNKPGDKKHFENEREYTSEELDKLLDSVDDIKELYDKI